MNYIILIIVGIAGIVLGTYLGRRRKMKKESRPSNDAPAGGEARQRRQDQAKNYASK